MPYQKPCQWEPCGKVFESKDRDAKYCHPNCYAQAAVKIRLPRQCAHCRIDFQWSRKEARYCSGECAAAARKKKRAEAREKAGLERAKEKYREKEDQTLTDLYADMAAEFAAPAETAPFPEAGASKWETPAPAPEPIDASGRYARILFWPDTHLPYEDKRAVALALQICRSFDPEILVFLGDMLDMTGFSRFPHDPVEKRNHFQNECDEWYALAQAAKDATPNARQRYFIEGNHEFRLTKWLYGQAHLVTWSGFNMGSVLRLADFGIDPQVRKSLSFCQDKLTVKHGTFIGGNFAGTAARQEMARAGTSGVSGHTHRLCEYYQRDLAGLRVWIESGHLALNPQHYLEGQLANWCQGVTIGEISVDGNDFHLEAIPFRLSYKARVGGKEFRG